MPAIEAVDTVPTHLFILLQSQMLAVDLLRFLTISKSVPRLVFGRTNAVGEGGLSSAEDALLLKPNKKIESWLTFL
jgi:hypothetical protein